MKVGRPRGNTEEVLERAESVLSNLGTKRLEPLGISRKQALYAISATIDEDELDQIRASGDGMPERD